MYTHGVSLKPVPSVRNSRIVVQEQKTITSILSCFGSVTEKQTSSAHLRMETSPPRCFQDEESDQMLCKERGMGRGAERTVRMCTELHFSVFPLLLAKHCNFFLLDLRNVFQKCIGSREDL